MPWTGASRRGNTRGSVEWSVCGHRGGDNREALGAAAARSCDRPHRLKRCGDTMVTLIASSAWRAQSGVWAALACEAKRAGARAVRGKACRLRCLLLVVPARSLRADARVSSRHPPNLTLLVVRRPVLHVCAEWATERTFPHYSTVQVSRKSLPTESFRFLWRTGSSARRANASQYLVRRGRCEHALNTNSC